jgi:5-methylcytosine-specific restriction protein A
MALANLSDPQAVHEAMDERDDIGEEAFLTKYKAGEARRYMVMRDGVAYDSKAIAAAAHGYQFGQPMDPAEFSGGMATVVPKLEELGFGVVDRDNAEPSGGLRAQSLSGLLAYALSLLPAALEEEFTDHPLGRLLVREIPDALAPAIPQAGYKVQGSPGKGRWAATVWVSVFDRLVTTSAQYGYYLVYLFRRDGSGVYLSLNQGTTAVHTEVGGRRYRSVLRDRASVYAGLLGEAALAVLEQGEIQLGGDGMLTRGYEAGNVAAAYYPAGSIPNDAQLYADLQRFVELYRKLTEANDLLADDSNPSGTNDADEPGAADTEPAVEARKLRWHLRAERNPRLVRDAKRHHGTTCMVCGFNYGDSYGELGQGYIEAHHLTPFAELTERPTTLDPRRDFAMVCASCHRMIHRRRPPYDLNTVREALGRGRR